MPAPSAAPPVVSGQEISFEEFLAAYDGVHAEWVDGKARVMSPGNDRQSRLTRFLGGLIQEWAEVHGLGEAFVAPYALRLGDRTGREPDVFFLRREHLERLRGTFVEGPADLVVEISSPSTRGQDRGEKFYEYEEAGIQEYWLIDPERKHVEAYRLNEDRTYAPVSLGDPPTLRSEAVPGLWFRVDWLWQSPLPLQSAVRREWGIE